MTALDKEIEQLQADIYSDVLSIIDKYVTITSLDVPENDEALAQKKIIAIMEQAIQETKEKN